MRKSWLIVAVVVLSAVSAWGAGFGVTNIVVKQHWPWNGLVDIDYEVVAEDAGAQYWVYPKATDNRLGRPVKMISLTGDGATNSVGVGTHRMVWDAKADNPGFHTTDLAVTIQAVADSALYLVIDLSGGKDAVTYPMRYSTTAPDLSDDTCRTTELWLRLVLPGTFTMGSPSTSAGRRSDETQHVVTLTKPYFLGVFEITQKQYELVTGNAVAESDSSWGPDRARVGITYDAIRGTSAGKGWPQSDAVDGSSFMGKMRARTQLHWDLPTEAQWEYACRAGTTTDINNGENLTNIVQDVSMGAVAIYYRNSIQRVGKKSPNAWMLYDMHGNAPEWCLDWYAAYPTAHVADPVGWVNSASGGRVIRGGSSQEDAYLCTSSRRFNLASGNNAIWMTYYQSVGFRAAVLPFGE